MRPFFATVLCLASCGSGNATNDGGATNQDTGTAQCASDPLKTGLVAQQTGVSVDAFDCPILEWTAKIGEPDAMIFKAIIYTESRFDHLSVGCTNNPCGVPSGWSTNETGCFGLMQVVPACAGPVVAPCILPNGHPNITKDSASSDWATSVFNPSINIRIGIGGLADNRAQEKKKFPGCTEDQYTMMALGDYGNYGSTKGCTDYNHTHTDVVVAAYKQYATAAGYPAHAY